MPDGQTDSFCDPRDQFIAPAQPQLSERFHNQDGVEPWSPERIYTHQGQVAMPWGSGDLSSVPAALLSGIYDASIPYEHEKMSKEAFYSDVENIMGRLPTRQAFKSGDQPPPQVSHVFGHLVDDYPPKGVAFQCRVDRAATPLGAETDAADGQHDKQLV